MLLTNIKRIVRSGFVGFWRNGFVSLASVLIMIVTLFVIGSVIFMLATMDATLNDIQSKVDINVYLMPSASEDDALALQKSLKGLPEVKEVEYVSREQALENFKKRNENRASILDALSEVGGENPLGAVLNVRAKDPLQYEAIATFLKSDNTLSSDRTSIIRRVTYDDSKKSIDTLSVAIASAQKLGIAVTLVFVVISILIIFNTIGLAIFNSREEISVMRLVGASNKYIRGPFIISGIMYGFLAGIITLTIFFPITYTLGTSTAGFFNGINVYNYYLANFFQFFCVIIGSGILLGVISSYLAVRRYLKV